MGGFLGDFSVSLSGDVSGNVSLHCSWPRCSCFEHGQLGPWQRAARGSSHLRCRGCFRPNKSQSWSGVSVHSWKQTQQLAGAARRSSRSSSSGIPQTFLACQRRQCWRFSSNLPVPFTACLGRLHRCVPRQRAQLPAAHCNLSLELSAASRRQMLFFPCVFSQKRTKRTFTP